MAQQELLVPAPCPAAAGAASPSATPMMQQGRACTHLDQRLCRLLLSLVDAGRLREQHLAAALDRKLHRRGGEELGVPATVMKPAGAGAAGAGRAPAGPAQPQGGSCKQDGSGAAGRRRERAAPIGLRCSPFERRTARKSATAAAPHLSGLCQALQILASGSQLGCEHSGLLVHHIAAAGGGAQGVEAGGTACRAPVRTRCRKAAPPWGAAAHRAWRRRAVRASGSVARTASEWGARGRTATARMQGH